MSLTCETWSWRSPSSPRLHAPSPRAANQRSRIAGAEITPTCSSPSASTASSVPKSGTPRMKLWVPSIGSMYQRIRAPPASSPYSSPTRPCVGNADPMRPRISRSISWSATVTNVRSGLRLTAMSRRKWARASASAASHAPCANSSQARRSASDARRRPADQAGPKAGIGARSASGGRRQRLRHRPMPGGRRDEAEQVGGAGHLQLVEEEPDLGALRGEDLVLRGQLPDLALERADCLLAGRVDELRVGHAGLALVGRVREAPRLDLAVELRRERGMLVERVLEAGGKVDLGRLDAREAVEQLVRERARTVLHRAGCPVRPGDLAEHAEHLEVELDLGAATAGERHAAMAGAGLDADLADADRARVPRVELQ